MEGEALLVKVKRDRPAAPYVLVAALGILGLAGIAGGIGFVSDPSGEANGMSVDWLEGSPLGDYLVPGVVLLTLLGVVPLIVGGALWRRRSWGRPAAVGVGLCLLVWLGVQILVVGYHSEPPLQLVFGALGVCVVVLALLPSVRLSCRR